MARIGSDGLCHCDGPPHAWDPKWCGGTLPSDRVTIVVVDPERPTRILNL